jgi:hypothetical protein
VKNSIEMVHGEQEYRGSRQWYLFITFYFYLGNGDLGEWLMVPIFEYLLDKN